MLLPSFSSLISPDHHHRHTFLITKAAPSPSPLLLFVHRPSAKLDLDGGSCPLIPCGAPTFPRTGIGTPHTGIAVFTSRQRGLVIRTNSITSTFSDATSTGRQRHLRSPPTRPHLLKEIPTLSPQKPTTASSKAKLVRLRLRCFPPPAPAPGLSFPFASWHPLMTLIRGSVHPSPGAFIPRLYLHSRLSPQIGSSLSCSYADSGSSVPDVGVDLPGEPRHSESMAVVGGRRRFDDWLLGGLFGGCEEEGEDLPLCEEEDEDSQSRGNLHLLPLNTFSLLGFSLKVGLVCLLLWAMGLCAFCAPWLVLNCVVPAPVSHTTALRMFVHDSIFLIEWLEDRDKYFADDSVHRFKLRPSLTATSIPYHFPVPQLGPVISTLRQSIGQPPNHIHISIWGLHSVSAGSSHVKSILSEKLGSPLAPSLSASPFGMFLCRRCFGGLVFGYVYQLRDLLYFTSTMWFYWSLRWICCIFAMISAHARSIAATATPPQVLDLAPSAAHACRAGSLSADIPLLVNLQSVTSLASLPLSGMSLSDYYCSITVFYLSCNFHSCLSPLGFCLNCLENLVIPIYLDGPECQVFIL